MPGLAEAVEAILEAVADALDADTASGGELEDVDTVVRGDRARPMPGLPAVWVIAEPATYGQDVYGGTEAWTMPVRLVAMVKDDSTTTGAVQARQIAATARRVVMKDRKLGLEYVVDTLSLTFDPTAPAPENKRNLFRADARIQVTFTVDEDENS